VTFLTPLNVQKNSTITINWTFSGTQNTIVELGISNDQQRIVIDNNIDLKKRNENWTVTVDAGIYRLFLYDLTSRIYTYSNSVTVSHLYDLTANTSSKTSTASQTASQTDTPNEAFTIPPLCVIIKCDNDKVLQVLLNIIFTIPYIPGVIHALYW
ncbi:6602_t:CDS:2, partial [Racocetra persica]